MNINKRKKLYGYIRVSTNKQGEGVSLEVQKKDIERFAQTNHIEIIEWFEEKRSASKGYRPEFNRMMQLLYSKKADGFVAHKIDRMMRNRNDWAVINELVDKVGRIVLAVDGIDLSDVNNRFVADIFAAHSTFYAGNLKGEAKKGIYGRLDQGFLPRSAPIGYLNNGGGKDKTIDPVKGPLVKKLFELYTKKGYTVRMLVKEMYKRGLRNTRGNKVSKNSMIAILKNPFYAGIILTKDQRHKGSHTALINMYTHKKVQDIMSGKTNTKKHKHEFLFRKLLTCKGCNYRLIGELQKGHVYYRCHTKGCPTKSIRESTINLFVKNLLKTIQLKNEEVKAIEEILLSIKHEWIAKQYELSKSINLRIGTLDTRLQRITDLLIQGVLAANDYESEKQKALEQKQELLEQQTLVSSEKTEFMQKVEDFLELAKKPNILYDLANLQEKREILEIVTSNLYVEGKKVMFSMVSPFSRLANRDILSFGGDDKPTARNKECTISYSSVQTSPIIPVPLNNEKCRKLFDVLLEETSSLPNFNLPNINELQTNYPSTESST